jgi:hypothetical protein
MWMINPQIMCRNHLFGEHLEIHMFLGTLREKKSIQGYLKNNCCEPKAFKERHDSLVSEMRNRKWFGHKTPVENINCECVFNLPQEQQDWKVNNERSLDDLISRCPKCKERYDKLQKGEL